MNGELLKLVEDTNRRIQKSILVENQIQKIREDYEKGLISEIEVKKFLKDLGRKAIKYVSPKKEVPLDSKILKKYPSSSTKNQRRKEWKDLTTNTFLDTQRRKGVRPGVRTIPAIESTETNINNNILIRTTYSTVTPESAEQGDFSDQGWIDEEGESFDTPEEAVRWLEKKGVQDASSSHFHPGIWYSSGDDESNATGEVTTYSFHITAPEETQKVIYDMMKSKRVI